MRACERFLKYIRVHTTSDPASSAAPSSAIQLDLAHMLVEEMTEGMEGGDDHSGHDHDDHDDPSWDIQYFAEDPHVLGVSREREIPISYMPVVEEGHVLGASREKNPVENVLGVSRSVQTGDAGHMNAYAIASILSILTLAGWAVSYKER